jgi:hypothetical protein
MVLPTTNTTPATTLRLRGDEDDDDEGIAKIGYNQPSDSDADVDNDYQDLLKKGYFDGDDGVRRSYGHAATPEQRRALTAVLERYFAAVAKEDGRLACALLTPAYASSLPEDYGRKAAGTYVVGAKTCAAVLTGVFRHEHAMLAAPIEVIDVRVNGAQAIALDGSTTMPARQLDLARQGRQWRIEGILGTSLP